MAITIIRDPFEKFSKSQGVNVSSSTNTEEKKPNVIKPEEKLPTRTYV
jgi:hypothetical protein